MCDRESLFMCDGFPDRLGGPAACHGARRQCSRFTAYHARSVSIDPALLQGPRSGPARVPADRGCLFLSAAVILVVSPATLWGSTLTMRLLPTTSAHLRSRLRFLRTRRTLRTRSGH